MSQLLRGRRSRQSPTDILCGRLGCGGKLGRTAVGYRSFSVPPSFVQRSDMEGVFYEFPEARARRERRGMQPIHHFIDPVREYRNLGEGRWEVVRDSTITSGRMPMWREVVLPARVRCPNCKWLQLVDYEVLNAAGGRAAP